MCFVPAHTQIIFSPTAERSPAGRAGAWGSFDDFVGAGGQLGGYLNAERHCGLQVNEQLDFSYLLDWQVSGLFAFEDTAGVDTSPTERIRNAASVAHQAASRSE